MLTNNNSVVECTQALFFYGLCWRAQSQRVRANSTQFIEKTLLVLPGFNPKVSSGT